MIRNKKLVAGLMAVGLISWAGYSNAELKLQDGYDAVATEGIDINQFLSQKEFTSDSIAAGKIGDNYLDAINAEYAWARGFTGAGSKILIIDSGINLGHDEFAGSVTDTKSFLRRSRTGITDRVGHGTGLASIAAGNWDGVGVAGVAPDADLAIAKVTDNGRIGFSQVLQAVKWGGQINADVANISANTDYRSTFRRNWRQTDDGAWYNDHRTYVRNYYTGRRATGFYGGENPLKWARALNGADMVIVNSAGNGGLAMPENPAPMAIATKDNGELWLNGQMLIVGAWDVQNESIARYSNRAGHICQGKNLDMKSGTCADEYRISDFYIMAPGNAFTASKTGDLYNIQTGTSQAAAVVSGAVAVVKQAWPHLSAKDTVTLLTQTANRDIKGYDKEVHGMGLLDLEKATRPLGEVGIPTTGDRNGAKMTLSGGFSTSSGDGLEEIAGALSSVMVTDELGRDYYVNMAQSANNKARRADWNPISKANFYARDFNPYHRLNMYTQSGSVQLKELDMKMSFDEYNATGMFEFGHTTQFGDTGKTKLRVGAGMLNEKDGFMGNYMSGVMGQVDGSYTSYTNFSGAYELDDKLSMFGNYWMGYTQVDQTAKGFVTGIEDTETYSWSAGVDYTNKEHSVGFTVSQPVTISQGTLNVSIPVGLTANGDVAYYNDKVSMAPKTPEIDIGTYYKFNSTDVKIGKTKANASFTGFAEHQMNYLNQEGVDNQVAGFMFTMDF